MENPALPDEKIRDRILKAGLSSPIIVNVVSREDLNQLIKINGNTNLLQVDDIDKVTTTIGEYK